MNGDDDRLSAYLDNELDPAGRAEVEAARASDPELAAELAALASVRHRLRIDGLVDLPRGSQDRIVASVLSRSAPRRVPVFAAVAASLVIVVGVVGGLLGGLEGRATLPAVNNFVARHEAVAAEPEPAVVDDRPPLDDMPIMGDEMEMMQASVADNVVHVLYEDSHGVYLSIFRSVGEPDMDGLADEIATGEVSAMNGHALWRATLGRVHVVVFDGDGYVWTLVSDTVYDAWSDMVADLPTYHPSLGERAHRLVEAVVEPFQLGVT